MHRSHLRLAIRPHVQRRCVVVEVIGVQVAVAKELVSIAVQAVGAGLRYDADQRAARASGFRRVSAALDLELRDRIDAGRIEQR